MEYFDVLMWLFYNDMGNINPVPLWRKSHRIVESAVVDAVVGHDIPLSFYERVENAHFKVESSTEGRSSYPTDYL